jgi:hypothetical protein
MLPTPQLELWSSYAELDQNGLQDEALETLRAFLDSLGTLGEEAQDAWALRHAEAIVDGGVAAPVRVPLFLEVVFPALVRGVTRDAPGCARWTAGLLHVVREREERLQLPEGARTEIQLLRKALILDPSDGASRTHLVEELSSAMEYATHEAPSMMLWDQGPVTTQQQCDELLAELAELEHHMKIADITEVRDGKLADLAEFCRFHLTAYRAFLGTRQEKESYLDFLERTDCDFSDGETG